jgi:hypothetical protein
MTGLLAFDHRAKQRRFMPPRWGLGLVEPAACYKLVAPLALGNSPLKEDQ